MDFELSPEDREFQLEVRAGIAEDLPPELAASLVPHRRATTIYGGANEVQRNIIARTILEL